MQRRVHTIRQLVFAAGAVCLVSGCSHYIMHDAAYQQGRVTELLKLVEQADSHSSSTPVESTQIYNEVLARTKVRHKFVDHQKALMSELSAVSHDATNPNLSDEAGLGFPEIYARSTLATAKAHLGLATIYLASKDWSRAAREAEDAESTIRDCEYCPHTVSRILLESNSIMNHIYLSQGAIGKALIQKLKVDLLQDHLKSEAGVEEYFLERRAFSGEAARRQYGEVAQLFTAVRMHRREQAAADRMAALGGLAALNAGLRPNSTQAQAHLNLVNMAISTSARAEAKALHAKSTPWSIPSFTQQLVDPRLGANTPTILKDFAMNAASAGGASYQTGAQQMNQAVDALAPYRQSGKTDGAAEQVEKFAETFNAFLTQVQEIKK